MAQKKLKITKVWCGHIPEIYGYGIMVMECTEDECRKSLKRMFQAWRKTMKGTYNYPEAMDYFGGRIFEVVTGKQYYDGFGE
jgi:hypothetical protein